MSAVKGSRPRNNFSRQYRDNYDAVFNKPKRRKKTGAKCKKCNGIGWYEYGHNHSTICDQCCKHDQGWWELSKEHHGSRFIDGEDNFCCRAGCGTMRRDLSKKTGEKTGENNFFIHEKTPHIIIGGNFVPVSSVKFMNIEEDFYGRDLVTFEYQGETMQSLVVMR